MKSSRKEYYQHLYRPSLNLTVGLQFVVKHDKRPVQESRMKNVLHYLSLYSFPIIMLVIGALDLARPDSLKSAMEAVSMPSYLLLILGVFKILGSLALLLKVHWRLKEWAYAGFFIWAAGGISSHLLSGHSISESFPIFFFLVLLGLSFFTYSNYSSNA